MTRVRFKKLMCLLLAVIITALMVPPTPVVAIAQEKASQAKTAQENQEKTKEELFKDATAGLLTVEEAFGTLDADTVPEIVGYDSAVARTHIARMYEEEGDNLNKVIFLNADGSRTAYFYDHPVKYIDSAGEIKDISLDIAEADVAGHFKTAANSSVTTFSKNVTDGISLRNGDSNISLVPHLPSAVTKTLTAEKAVANATAKKIDSKTVAYTYDDKTTLEYSLTYTGFKEDIVVSEYTGQTEYDFTLYTNGLKLTEQHGSFYLVDATGVVKAQLGDIIIFTADDRNNTMGDMVAQTVVENQEYRLTILVDPEFLADKKTVYPIRIDPTVEFTHEDNGPGAIEDVTINSNGGSDGTAYSLSVGLREDYGIARTLMKFPIVEEAYGGTNLIITDAKVEIRDLMCEDEDLQVACYVFSGNEWTESTAEWSNVSPYSTSTLLSSHTISYTHGAQQPEWQTYAFDITEAVEGWLTGDFNIDTGIIFRAPYFIENGSTYIHKTLASFNRSAYQPSLSITYIDFEDAYEIGTNVLTSVTVPTAGSSAVFSFKPASTGFYTFESSNIVSGDPYAWLYNLNFELLAEEDDADDANFRLTYHLVKDYTYYFRAGCYDTGVGNYSVKLSKTTNSSYVNAITMNWGNYSDVSCDWENSVSFYKFSPTASGEYLVYTSNASDDPEIWIYNSAMNLIASADDGAGDYNARLATTLSSGQTYYIAAGHYGYGNGTYKMNILLSANIVSGVYSLKNVGTVQYMDIHGPVAQEYVHQWTSHIGLQEKWTIQKQSDGYYTIRSEYGNRYYVGVSSSSTGENNIKLHSTVSDSTKWKIFEDNLGYVILEPKTAPGKVLYAPNTGIGTELQLSLMSVSVSNRNHWRVLNIGTYFAQVYNYFDDGYSVYYNETNSVSRSLINGYMDDIADRYYDLFGLTLLYDSASYYESPIDVCKGTVSSSNISTSCTHSGTAHTERGNVISSFRNNFSGGNTITNVLWSCHAITSTATNGEINYNRSCSYRDAIIMIKRSSSTSRTLNTKGVLMHELNHQYGAKDHYHELTDQSDSNSCKFKSICSKCGDNPRPKSCIMNETSTDISNPDVICSACQSDILTHLNSHHTN